MEFSLKEEGISFVRLCCEIEVPFTYCPPYGLAMEIAHLENLIKICEMNEHLSINQKIPFEYHPLLKLP